MAFQTIKTSDIEYVEKFVKTELSTRIQDNYDKMHFFGGYSKDPKQFIFSRGEIRLVEEIVKYLSEKVKSSKGLSQFKQNDINIETNEINRAKQELIETTIGLFFRKQVTAIDLPIPSQSFDETSNEFIDLSEYARKLVSDSVESDVLKVEKESASNEQLEFLIDSFYTQLFSRNMCNKNGVIKNEEQTKVLIADYTARSKESKPLIKICETEGNGNCLFAALTHQIFHPKMNSTEHKEMIKKLRGDVIEYILKNLEYFKHDLKNRMLEDATFHFDSNEFEANITIFVKEKLSQNGYWGGQETLEAVSLLYHVNILIVNDDGTCNLGNRFNTNYSVAIIISFRSQGSRNLKRNHYDTVAEMSDSLMKKFAVSAMEDYENKINLQNEITNCSNFVYQLE